MKYYILLLTWILFLYYMSWFYTVERGESVLIKVTKRFANIFFYMRQENRMSIAGIIIGLFAHISMIFYFALIICHNMVKEYIAGIAVIWVYVSFFVMFIGEIAETSVKIKRSTTKKQKRENCGMMFLLLFSIGVAFYVVVHIIFS